MRIDASFMQAASPLAYTARAEGPGEMENDGDADDTAQAVSRTRPGGQTWGMWGPGVGTKIDLMA